METLGLDCLVHLNSVMIYQKVDYLEVFAGFSSNRRYAIQSTPTDEPILFAVQDNGFWSRAFKAKYNMTMRVMNAAKTDLMIVSRAKNHDCCERPKLDVFVPPENKIGSIKYHMGCFRDFLEIYDPEGALMYKVIPSSARKKNKFKIEDSNQTVVGKIQKEHAGFFQENFTEADNYEVEFKNANIRTKALFLATVFFIDAIYHERYGFKPTVITKSIF